MFLKVVGLVKCTGVGIMWISVGAVKQLQTANIETHIWDTSSSQLSVCFQLIHCTMEQPSHLYGEQLRFVLTYVLVRVLPKPKDGLYTKEQICRKRAVQTPTFAATCLQPGSLWEDHLDLTWCSRAVHGWTATLFLCCGWQILEPSTSKWCDITQNRALLNIILTAYLQVRADTYCVLARCLFSGFLAYMIPCHENKSKCFGTHVTPFKSTDSSVHFMFITFIHFSSGGSD